MKAASSFSEGALRGLRAIADLGGLRRRVLVYLGLRRMRTADGIDILPLAHFLDLVATGSLTE